MERGREREREREEEIDNVLHTPSNLIRCEVSTLQQALPTLLIKL